MHGIGLCIELHGFSLMPVVYQVLGLARGIGRHSGRRGGGTDGIADVIADIIVHAAAARRLSMTTGRSA